MKQDRMHRRRLVQAGVAGIGGLGLSNLLFADRLREVTDGRSATARSCIFIVLSGGPGQHETFDPKPDAPREIRGLYGSIQTRTPGMLLSDRMPLLAEQSDKFCLVRSMSHTDVVHVSAAHTMLTGQPDGSPANESPMIGSLVSRFRPADGSLPSHVWLHNMKTGTNKVPRYDSGLNLIGHAHAALHVGHENDNPATDGFRVRHFDPLPGSTVSRINERFDLLSRLEDGREDHSGLGKAPAGYAEFQRKAHELLTGHAAREAFELGRESESVRDRYGRHPLGQYALMSRRLVEAGVRLVTLTGWPGLAPGETEPTVTQVWDTHDSYYSEGDNMYGTGPYGMAWAIPRLDQALSALLSDLHDRGLLDETLVVAAGEFGRTPRFEGKGRGRGHWPNCYSVLFAGGGVRGGSFHGESDAQGAFVAAGRPVSHLDFGATLFQALGIPPETRYGPDRFSFKVSDGTPLTEIFG